MYCTQIINVKKTVVNICRIFNECTNLGLHSISQSISHRSTVPVTKATTCCHCEVGVREGRHIAAIVWRCMVRVAGITVLPMQLVVPITTKCARVRFSPTMVRYNYTRYNLIYVIKIYQSVTFTRGRYPCFSRLKLILTVLI